MDRLKDKYKWDFDESCFEWNNQKKVVINNYLPLVGYCL